MRKPQPRVLLVEGREELRVLPYLLEAAGVPWPKGNEPVHIEPLDGIEKLLEPDLFETHLKASGLEALGILIDANGDVSRRWDALRGRLRAPVPGLPADCDPAGTIVDATPRIGIWMMPDNVRTGMLESLLLELRVGTPELKEHATTSARRATELGAPYRPAHQHKADLHTWLAWQDPPGLQLHVAVEAGLVRPSLEQCGQFVDWFRRLFRV